MLDDFGLPRYLAIVMKSRTAPSIRPPVRPDNVHAATSSYFAKTTLRTCSTEFARIRTR